MATKPADRGAVAVRAVPVAAVAGAGPVGSKRAVAGIVEMRRRLPSHPRHPGLVPGSTGQRRHRLSLQPFPSPRSGPRNESGVTGRAWRCCVPLSVAGKRDVAHG
ncbi:hypothetical protein WR25_08610 [Diploscapter pachys]|uniref:Uncharacterized protein n=1 Tax=Diploscapter pachys TaxID=2018661 RepID=A0A2A2M5G6_9BILA|nr:hypothetical protein WR25_08610 [Diploscapter pachys]